MPIFEDRDTYVLTVLHRYRNTPGTTGQVRHADREIAGRLYDESISLALIEAAFLLTVARRTFRHADAPLLGPIRSLHYVVPVIRELLQHPPDPDYIRYLRTKLARHARDGR